MDELTAKIAFVEDQIRELALKIEEQKEQVRNLDAEISEGRNAGKDVANLRTEKVAVMSVYAELLIQKRLLEQKLEPKGDFFVSFILFIIFI